MRPLFRTRLFRMSAFEMMICSPVDAADARALHADVLDGAVEVVHLQRIADGEGLVERDRHRGEQIAQHRLHGERDRDAADAEAGEQRLDLDAEVVEREQERHRPDGEPGDEHDDVDGARERRIRAAAALRARWSMAKRTAAMPHRPTWNQKVSTMAMLHAVLDAIRETRAAWTASATAMVNRNSLLVRSTSSAATSMASGSSRPACAHLRRCELM